MKTKHADKIIRIISAIMCLVIVVCFIKPTPVSARTVSGINGAVPNYCILVVSEPCFGKGSTTWKFKNTGSDPFYVEVRNKENVKITAGKNWGIGTLISQSQPVYKGDTCSVTISKANGGLLSYGFSSYDIYILSELGTPVKVDVTTSGAKYNSVGCACGN